ncbi:gliding motility lipoprotein GldH [Winogradskyella jejuensis]|uniref:Protein involved in gliding motility GldH n=1 Tax=Winogradskyella jejuensis TaxID=1089305 RepID=A0A1M5MLW7_9FLAO|nr:gliding motility lipoprotein GldH [Winogradskyella jejuensis]SHG78370.1 protein involved in gliding motility GldH [Winogradskyella jejuensis]
MPKKIKVFLVLVLPLILVVSCDSKSVFDEYQSLPNAWGKDQIISFSFEALDTTSTYNLFINLRNNNNYKFSNLYLITDLEYPNGKTLIDTLEYKMSEPDGTLLGEGFTDVKENKLWYKGHKAPFIFKESGKYTFRIKHAMRAYGEVEGLDDLDGVTEVGFRVENK